MCRQDLVDYVSTLCDQKHFDEFILAVEANRSIVTDGQGILHDVSS